MCCTDHRHCHSHYRGDTGSVNGSRPDDDDSPRCNSPGDPGDVRWPSVLESEKGQ